MTGGASHWSSELIGVTLGGRYHIEGLIGAGGMGAVFKGVHQGTGRRVAVKLLIPEFRQHPKAIKRFQIEAKAAASTNRRGVVDVLDYDVDQSHGPYLVMELLEGESLEQRIERLRHLEPTEALTIAVEILDTLEAVHQQGIVHRDLKPANIFLARTEEGEELVKVLDFGISRVDSADRQTKLTTPGMAVGTPRYMAPEQAQCDPDVDLRADIYSVGAILYEALSGTKPYADTFPGQILSEVILRSPRPFHEVSLYPDRGLVAVVERAMARQRDARFASTRAMSKRLVELRSELLYGGLSDEPPTVIDHGFSSIIAQAKAEAETETETETERERASRPHAAPARSLPRQVDAPEQREVPTWPAEPFPRAHPPPVVTSSAPVFPPPSSPATSAPRESSRPTPPRRRWRRWWIPVVVIASLVVVVGVAISGGFLLGGRILGSSTSTSAMNMTAGAPTSQPPDVSQTNSPAPPRGDLRASEQGNELETRLRAELETARDEHRNGNAAAAQLRLNQLIQQAHAGGVQPETNEGGIVAEAHIFLCELLVGRIVAPSDSASGVDFDRTHRAMTAPYTEAVQHANQVARYMSGLRQCATVCNAQAAERLGDSYLRLCDSPAYCASLDESIQAFLQSAGRDHLMSAQGSFERAQSEVNSGCSSEATAGRLRVEARLAAAGR